MGRGTLALLSNKPRKVHDMSANFTKGFLTRLIRPESDQHARIYRASSWHGEEEGIEECRTADELIAHAERLGAFPLSVDTSLASVQIDGRLVTSSRDRVIVARYANDAPRIVGTCKGRWTYAGRDNWNGLIRAAVDSGARPAGGFSLDDGRKLCATFELDRGPAGRMGEILSHLTFCDPLDGSGHLMVIQSDDRTLCCNTLRRNVVQATGNGALLQARHTRSIGSKVRSMAEVMQEAVASARKIREVYAERAERKLSASEFEHLANKLWPMADKDATPHLRTRLDNERQEAMRAIARSENNVGNTVGTLHNAATWLVDRNSDGSARGPRGGGSALGSMLLGGMGDRVEEIETIIQVFMRDGSVQEVKASEALQTPGIDPQLVGRAVLSDMLGGDPWN